MFNRRRFKQRLFLQDRLSIWANQVREQAAKLPPGVEKDTLLKKARQADTASELNDWANPAGLLSPK
jgi:hypothetical protein